MTLAISADPVRAALVREGALWLLPVPRPTEHRGDVLVHATKAKPVHLSRVGEWWVHTAYTEPESGAELRRLGAVWDGELVPDRHECGLAIPLHFGAMVAVAHLDDCVPIVKRVVEQGSVIFESGGELWFCPADEHHPDFGGRVVSDQLPLADFSPGGWAAVLSNVRKLDPPVSEYPTDVAVYDYEGVQSAVRRRLVPVCGRSGWWQPAPELSEACARAVRS
jgi:hypothetical protein